MLEVVLGFDVAGDSSLRIPDKSNLEGHTGRRGSLHVESGAVDGEILAEEVTGGLSEVLKAKRRVRCETGDAAGHNTFQEGGTG